jgi:ubiquinone/menaquinone biosynthesis C-methylase UbiE
MARRRDRLFATRLIAKHAVLRGRAALLGCGATFSERSVLMTSINKLEPAPIAADVVVDEWKDQHLATVFSRWHAQLAVALQELAGVMIAEAGIQPGDSVIDIASGSGNPALVIAAAVGAGGHVTATDPSPVFLRALEEHVRAQNLANVTAIRCTAANLPVPDRHFDAATCQMGVMFFPDVVAGLASIRRVVKPGKRAAFAAWGPVPENQLFATFWQAVGPYLPAEGEPAASGPDEETPNPMRFARPGSLSERLHAAGFSDVREASPLVHLAWPGSADTLRNFWLELTRIEEKVPEDRHPSLRNDVASAFDRYAANGSVNLIARIVIASGSA